MASWASSRSANRASSRAEAERSPGSVSWQSRLDDSARNSADGSTDRGDRRSDASRDDDSASRRYGETQDEGSVSKAARRTAGFTTRRFTTGSDLRDRKHVGRTPRTSATPPANAVTVSKNFVVFVCAGLAFFGLSVLGAGRSNRAFERHFQEIAKVRADRRRLREENEALARENARLRRLEASGDGFGGGYDAAYHATERLVQEVSAIDGSIGGSIGGSIVYGFRG